MLDPTKSKLPFPAGSGSLSTLSPYGGSASAPIGIRGNELFEAEGIHYDGEELVYVKIRSTDPISAHNSVSIALTPEQWATVFAVVTSVAPKPVWSMTEELKRAI